MEGDETVVEKEPQKASASQYLKARLPVPVSVFKWQGSFSS